MNGEGDNTEENSNASSSKENSRQHQTTVPPWLITYFQHQEEMQKRRDEEQRRFQETISNLLINNQGNNESQQITPSVSNKNPRASRPSTLDIDVTYSKFRSWRNAWNDYVMLQELDKQPIEVQKADFRCCLSEDMRIHLKCAIDIEDRNEFSVSQILDKIQEYLRQKRNVALDRVAFEERKQQNGENFDDFYVSLRKLAEESDLCDECYEQRITTRIMSGIRDTNVRQKLLAITPFPELKKVVNICRSEESAMKDSSALETKIVIDKVTNRNSKPKFVKDNNHQEKCGKCGFQKHDKRLCPANKSECNLCHMTGHWAKMCKNKGKYDKQNRDGGSVSVNIGIFLGYRYFSTDTKPIPQNKFTRLAVSKLIQ